MVIYRDGLFLQLLGDQNPKLNRRKLRSNANSKTIMSFDVGIECQNEKLFLGAAESYIVEGISKYWRSSTEPVPSMMTISIRPYIRPTSRTTAALTSGGVAMQQG